MNVSLKEKDMANGQIVDHGGRVLQRANLFVRLRGAGWVTGAFTPNDANRSFEAALASPYLSSLVQYRGVRRTRMQGFQTDATNIGNLGPDPRHFVGGDIWLVKDADIRKIVIEMAKDRPPQEDDASLYMVAISQDPIPIVLEQLNASGYHDSFNDAGRTLHYAVLLNISSSDLDHTFHYLPGVFSHELAEACTDAEPATGFLFTDGDEICDLNDERPVNLTGLDREVNLAAYWSDLEKMAVVPTAYSLRVALGKRPAEAVPSVRALIKQTSILAAILAGCNP
jgi:hypothetical protein